MPNTSGAVSYTHLGKHPEDFKALATEAGVYRPGMKAGDLVAWLKAEFGLGHGHSMAIWAVFKDCLLYTSRCV